MTRKDIEKASLDYQISSYSSVFEGMADIIYKAKINTDFIAGAEWVLENILKSTDGEDLPEINREVIALLDNGKVVFAHRPPEYWDSRDIVTGEITRNYVERYDKGQWNQPNVKWWLDIDLSKSIQNNKLDD